MSESPICRTNLCPNPLNPQFNLHQSIFKIFELVEDLRGLQNMAMHSKDFSVYLDGGVNSIGGVFQNTRGRRKALNDISNSKSVIPIGEQHLDGGVKTNTLQKKKSGGGRKKPTSNAIGEDVGASKKMIKKRGRKALKKRMGSTDDEENKKSSTTSVVVVVAEEDADADAAEEKEEEEILVHHNHDECFKPDEYVDDFFERLCRATGHDPNSPPDHISPTDDMNFRSPSPTKPSSSSVRCIQDEEYSPFRCSFSWSEDWSIKESPECSE